MRVSVDSLGIVVASFGKRCANRTGCFDLSCCTCGKSWTFRHCHDTETTTASLPKRKMHSATRSISRGSGACPTNILCHASSTWTTRQRLRRGAPGGARCICPHATAELLTLPLCRPCSLTTQLPRTSLLSRNFTILSWHPVAPKSSRRIQRGQLTLVSTQVCKVRMAKVSVEKGGLDHQSSHRTFPMRAMVARASVAATRACVATLSPPQPTHTTLF